MNAKHTPGPWHNDNGIEIRAGETVSICGMRFPFNEDPEKEANARLISAAPDLLAALEAITRDYRQLLKEHLALTKEDGWNWGTMPADDADRAIAKAKGQS